MANRMTVGSPVKMQLVALPKPEEETKTGMRNAKFMYLKTIIVNPVSICLFRINNANRIMCGINTFNNKNIRMTLITSLWFLYR